jgi:hypothetical protein
MIRANRLRWSETVAGEIAGTVAILRVLHAAGTPLYALTNWSQETFNSCRDPHWCPARYPNSGRIGRLVDSLMP